MIRPLDFHRQTFRFLSTPNTNSDYFKKVFFPKYDSNPRYLKNTCVDVIFVSWIWSFFRFSVSSIVYLFTSRSTSQKSHISFIKFDISLWRTTGMLTIMTQCQFPPSLVHIWVWTKLTACSPKPWLFQAWSKILLAATFSWWLIPEVRPISQFIFWWKVSEKYVRYQRQNIRSWPPKHPKVEILLRISFTSNKWDKNDQRKYERHFD